MHPIPKRIACANTFSRTEYMVTPSEINDKNTMFGGAMLSHMDVVAGLSVSRATGLRCLTVGINDVQFLSPAYLNNFYTIEAMVTGISTTAVEVFVRFYVNDDVMQDRTLAVSAFYTYVPVMPENRQVPLPELVAESPEEKKLCQGFEARRRHNQKARLWTKEQHT